MPVVSNGPFYTLNPSGVGLPLNSSVVSAGSVTDFAKPGSQTGITAVTSNAAGTVLAFTQNKPTGPAVTLYDTTKPAASALQPLA